MNNPASPTSRSLVLVPAAITREVLLRTSPLTRGKWLAFLVFCVCVAISGLYELVEWAVAEFDSAGSTAFLGTQGDVWDTQKDIAFCAIGASIALATVPLVQDRELGLAGRRRPPDR